MTSHILTRHKWALYSHGQHIVVVKGRNERFVHPLMKALLWGLYIADYPNITIEIRLNDRYKPDVVAFEPADELRAGTPLFWGEAGQVGRKKIESLARRYPHTHLAIAKWDARLDPHIAIVEKALKGMRRTAPFDLISFAPDSDRFIDADGNITLTHADLTHWVRL